MSAWFLDSELSTCFLLQIDWFYYSCTNEGCANARQLKKGKIFQQIIHETCMTEESNSPDGNSFLQHQPVWRSDSK